MEKKHIQFIIKDEWANEILDEADVIGQKILTIDQRFIDNEVNDDEVDQLNDDTATLMARMKELIDKIEERYTVDEDSPLWMPWFIYTQVGGKQRLFDAVREEQHIG